MKYIVRDPAGNRHEIEAPDGASDAELIAIAQQRPQPVVPSQEVAAEKKPPTLFDLAKPEFLSGGVEAAADKIGGKATDFFAKYLPPEVAAGAGYVGNVATQLIPMAVGGLGGKAVEPLAQEAGRSLMQSALKPNVKHDLLQGKAAKAIDYMLENGIPVSQGGLKTIYQNIDKLRGEIGQLVQNSTGIVDKNAVARELQGTLDKFVKTVNPKNSLESITEAWKQFLNHPMLGQSGIPVQLAQEMKQTTNAFLRNSYGELKGAEIEAQKGLVRGLRKEIEKVIPDIAKLNAKEGAAMDARLLTELRLHGELNKDPGGMAWLAAHNPQYALGWLASRSSYIKSLLAKGLYKGAPTAGSAAGAAYGSGQAE